MMSEQDLAHVLQIAVQDLSPDHSVLENDVTDEGELALKQRGFNCEDPSIKSSLYSVNQTRCLWLDRIEAKLQARGYLEISGREARPAHQQTAQSHPGLHLVPATECCVLFLDVGRIIIVKVPGQDDSHDEDGESRSQSSHSASN